MPRPPAGRAVTAIAPAPLVPPDVVVLDTSAAIEALLDDQPRHDEYAAFLAACAAGGTAIAYCEILELELAEACVGIALARIHGRDWRRKRNDGRALRPARKLIEETAAKWQAFLDSVEQTLRVPLDWGTLHDDAEHVETFGAAVLDRAIGLMQRYPIASYDAAHAATALLLEAPIVTGDRGFARVSGLEILTDSASVPICRRVRGGRQSGTSSGGH